MENRDDDSENQNTDNDAKLDHSEAAATDPTSGEEAQTTQPQQPSGSGETANVPIKKPLWKSKKLWLILALIIVIGGLGAYAYWWHNRDSQTDKAQTVHQKSPTKAVVQQATFLTTPEKLSQDLNFFKFPNAYFDGPCLGNDACGPSSSASNVSYYQIGTTASKQPIVVAYYTNNEQGDAGNSYRYVAIEDRPNHYTILLQLDDAFYTKPDSFLSEDGQKNLDTFKSGLNDTVSVDTTTTMPALMLPVTVTVKGLPLTQIYGDEPLYNVSGVGYFLPNGLKSIRGQYRGDQTVSTAHSIAMIDGKTYYEVVAEDSANYSVNEIYGAVNQAFAEPYYVVGNSITDSKGLAATWTSGSSNKSVYDSAAAGCGSASGYVIAKNVGANDLTPVGTAADGQTLYELSNSAPLLQELYNNDYTDSKSYLEDKSLQDLTVQQFQDEHAVILAKNSLGEYVVYQRNDMFLRGGCGKPVVYLYPPAPTLVNVNVDADITKSDPYYQKGIGWQNVLALPGSRLLYDGKGYDSLFWEGFGHGIYPDVSTVGTVVPKNQVVPTIRTQLKMQGLNQKEVSDFLSFWQPKLPGTPYTRLTWLSTAQMNQLAPLNISPRPQTLIRTFLDFQGLTKPEKLQPQTFTTPARNGFTVVEWGGLLRDGSVPQQ